MGVKGKKSSADFNLCCGNFPVERPTKKDPKTGKLIHEAYCKQCNKHVEGATRAELVRKWNDESIDAQLCGQCGAKLDISTWAYCPHCACPTSQK